MLLNSSILIINDQPLQNELHPWLPQQYHHLEETAHGVPHQWRNKRDHKYKVTGNPQSTENICCTPIPAQPSQEPELSMSGSRQRKGRPKVARTSSASDARTPESQVHTITTRPHPMECKKMLQKATHNGCHRKALKMHTTAITALQTSTTRRSSPLL